MARSLLLGRRRVEAAPCEAGRTSGHGPGRTRERGQGAMDQDGPVVRVAGRPALFLRETRAGAAGKPRAMFALDLSTPVARLTLDRPDARNAVPLAGWRELAARVREAQAAGARALVLAGSPSAFC